MADTSLARLLAKIARDERDCWLWQGSRNNHGYGWLMVRKGELRLAHRVAYEAFVGPIPDGLVIDHLCRTPACVNPDHLEAVTQGENIRRGTAAVRRAARYATRDACRNGHPNPGTRCIECRRESVRAYRARQKSLRMLAGETASRAGVVLSG